MLAIRQPDIFTEELRLTEPEPEIARSESRRDAESACSSDALVPDVRVATNLSHAPKYRNSPLSAASTLQLRASLEQRLEAFEDYKDPDLSLRSLSERIGMSPHLLSQVINESIGMNFFDFINDYRLQQVKRELLGDTGKTVLHIATDAGFNSKSSFYGFFK